MEYKRVTVFAGHYGSGKTNIAVNYALELRKQFQKVALADLDVVNPYFRAKDSERLMREHDIRLISSEYANSNVDVPALPGEMYAVVDDREMFSVVDVGGDDRGAMALGRYIHQIVDEDNYEMLLVINKYRPLTRNTQDLYEVVQEIEEATKVKFTAIVNNSNLGELTTAQHVLDSVGYANEIADITGIPVKMTAVKEELADELEGRIDNLFRIRLHIRQSWI